jgi:hypothetical protein
MSEICDKSNLGALFYYIITNVTIITTKVGLTIY